MASPCAPASGPRRLPPELVADILDRFVESAPSHALRTPDLASFARVSRDWHDIATPLLYRNVYVDSKARDGILAALEANPVLPTLVRELTLSGGKLTADAFRRLLATLERCEHVTSLTYHCFDDALVEDLTWFVSSTWPGLRYLRADQSQYLYDLLARLPHLETLVASYIEFPNLGPATSPVPSPPSSGRSSPSSASSPARPTFRLKRFDSGTSPLPANFQLLTSSSQSSLTSLDVPISSLISQDLAGFSSLDRLTVTLGERYLPVPSPDPRVPLAHGARDEARCLRRVRRLLRGVEDARVPLRHLEVFEPAYAATRPFDAAVFEREALLESVPDSVRLLDLATIAISAEYVARAFAHTVTTAVEATAVYDVCKGVTEMVLPRRVAQESAAGAMHSALAARGISVRWG
ncbi:hypothetical protein JCM3774_004284 [Rhodotorula dairenensis]